MRMVAGESTESSHTDATLSGHSAWVDRPLLCMAFRALASCRNSATCTSHLHVTVNVNVSNVRVHLLVPVPILVVEKRKRADMEDQAVQLLYPGARFTWLTCYGADYKLASDFKLAGRLLGSVSSESWCPWIIYWEQRAVVCACFSHQAITSLLVYVGLVYSVSLHY